jgi:hypothetical protein
LSLVSFLAAEKKRRAEEAQQSGPNASAAQSNGTVSLLLLYKPYFLYLLICYLNDFNQAVSALVQQLCESMTVIQNFAEPILISCIWWWLLNIDAHKSSVGLCYF